MRSRGYAALASRSLSCSRIPSSPGTLYGTAVLAEALAEE